MTTKTLIRKVLCCLMLLAGTAIAAEPSDEPIVVVNPQVNEQELSLGAVRTVFGMRLRNWKDGAPIKVFVLPDNHPLHVAFSKQVLGMFPHQLRWAWDRLVFSGTGQAPTQVATVEEMRNKVASTPGAVGYVGRSQMNGNFKILRIEN